MAANNELVVFALAERLIGVPAAAVRELIRAVAVTELPGAPTGVVGVIDLRGTLVPVVDLCARIGLTPRPIRASDQLLICEVATGRLAVRADRVIELRVIESDAVPIGAESDPIVRGLARAVEGVIVIADLAAFLSESDITALATAMARLGAAA
ncbi:chemotaxis protein CheW [soil metagenome]